MQFPLQRSPGVHEKQESVQGVRHAENYSDQKPKVVSGAFPGLHAFHRNQRVLKVVLQSQEKIIH